MKQLHTLWNSIAMQCYLLLTCLNMHVNVAKIHHLTPPSEDLHSDHNDAPTKRFAVLYRKNCCPTIIKEDFGSTTMRVVVIGRKSGRKEKKREVVFSYVYSPCNGQVCGESSIL